jgi:hypothetical protein
MENEEFDEAPVVPPENLGEGHKMARIGFGIGFALALWGFIYPSPFELVIVLLSLYPLVVIFYVWRFKGILKLYAPKGSGFPSASFALTMPVIVLFVIALLSPDIYQFGQAAWWKLIVVTVPIAIICLIATRAAVAGDEWQFALQLGIVVITGAYVYALLVISNFSLDHLKPQQYRARVERKRVESGKHTTYELYLSSWGQFRDSERVDVSHSVYNAVKIDDSVTVYLHKGKWDIPWLHVSN